MDWDCAILSLFLLPLPPLNVCVCQEIALRCHLSFFPPSLLPLSLCNVEYILSDEISQLYSRAYLMRPDPLGLIDPVSHIQSFFLSKFHHFFFFPN